MTKLNIKPNRGRGAWAETLCKLFWLLMTRRMTIDQLAKNAGVSKKTVYRYITMLSRYFPVVEKLVRVGDEVGGNFKYFYIEPKGQQVQGPNGRAATARFCPRGHDKLAKHGGYWVKGPRGRLFLGCAVCRRASNMIWWRSHRGKGKYYAPDPEFVVKSD